MPIANEFSPSEYKDALSQAFADACATLGYDVAATAELPREKNRGDFACAAALQLARALRRPPKDIAADILQKTALPDFVENADIDGGYINIRVKTAAKLAVVREALNRAADFGRAAPKNQTVLLEFVSANPTGPLHIGHGRAAAYGDSLAQILEFAGYKVHREYYVNDAGRQAEILAASVWLRHWLGGEELPAGAYRGEYLADAETAAKDLHSRMTPPNAAALREKMKSAENADAAADILAAEFRTHIADETARKEYMRCAADSVLSHIRADLKTIDVADFDCWFSEQEMHDGALPAAAIAELDKRGHLYEKDGALWFRASAAGDDKDRVLRRADGRYTYFAADIAYHHDKFSRNAARLINVLGADHHGYVLRLRAAIAALGHDVGKLETVLIQFVSLINSGVRIKMSTRGGKYVPLAVLAEEIGKDAARFFYVSRKNDRHLDLDMRLAAEKSRKNPVFYMQYAHARADAVLRSWEERGNKRETLAEANCDSLSDNPAALALCAKTAEFPTAAAVAAKDRAAHSLAAFLQELAGALHHYYEQTPLLKDAPEDEIPGRLALLSAAQTALRNGLQLLGVQAKATM